MNENNRMVYILYDHTRNLIKIGFTVNFPHRFRQHKSNEKTHLELLGIVLHAGATHESFLQNHLIITYKVRRYNNRKDWLTANQAAIDFLLSFDGSIFTPLQNNPTQILRGLTLYCLQDFLDGEAILFMLGKLRRLAFQRKLNIETLLEKIADGYIELDDIDENGEPPRYVKRLTAVPQNSIRDLIQMALPLQFP